MQLIRTLFAGVLVASSVIGAALAPTATMAQTRQIVNIYSSRHYGALEQTFNKFTEETGIEVRISQGSAQAILERLRAEGKYTVADLYFTIDAGGLGQAAEEGLLQPVESKILKDAIPTDLRDPQSRWFAFAQRFRVIVYNPAKVKPAELAGYATLADPKWNGRLCLRPATHIYTISLVGSLIAELGEAKATEIVQGWVANQPQMIDSDTRIVETIAAGGCDVGIVNHYYLARKLVEDPKYTVALFWPNQAEAGVHRNISGIGLTAASVNKDNAIKLMEWLAAADRGQSAEFGLPATSLEFPILPKVEPPAVLKSFGEFKIDPLALDTYWKYQQPAIDLLNKAGY